VQVDLPLVIAAEANAEHDVVHLLGGDGCTDGLARQRSLHPVEEGIHLIDLVSAP
jgi:hypothetical protein